MRTKTLFLAAVLGGASVATSMAQVYSVNAVGYINLTLNPGFTMIANQLDNKNPNGNTIGNLFQNVPESTTIYKFNPTTLSYSINSFEFGAWSNPADTLVPGQGAFISIPAGAPVTVTLVGDVPTGTLTTTIPAGFSIVSSQVPQSAALDTVLGFPVAEGDVVYFYNNATSAYSIYSYEFGAWNTVPVPAVGQSFFVNKAAPGATWTRTFTVN